jgi:hypothetical protein
MGQPVYTKLGYAVDDDLMERVVHTVVGENYHTVYTTWTMKADLEVEGVVVAVKGELMRQDAAPSILAGPGTRTVGGKVNGR